MEKRLRNIMFSLLHNDGSEYKIVVPPEMEIRTKAILQEIFSWYVREMRSAGGIEMPISLPLTVIIDRTMSKNEIRITLTERFAQVERNANEVVQSRATWIIFRECAASPVNTQKPNN